MILIACEESQVVCKSFREKGVEAYSCDLQDCSGGCPQWHIKADVLSILYGNCFFKTQDGVEHYVDKWQGLIGFPPCTFITKAGACRLYPQAGFLNVERYLKGIEAATFFNILFNCQIPFICLENPTPLKIFNLPVPSQVIQPYYFGHPFSKRTLLFLKGFPLLKPTLILQNFVPFIASNCSKNKGTGKNKNKVNGSISRSKTFLGIAAAMAEQWCQYFVKV